MPYRPTGPREPAQPLRKAGEHEGYPLASLFPPDSRGLRTIAPQAPR
jgi:hypothetical protein